MDAARSSLYINIIKLVIPAGIAGMTVYLTFVQNDECRASVEGQEVAAIEPPFLWILSFGGVKESISP